MPVIRVEMLSGRSYEQRSELARVLTDEMARVAKCASEDVQVIFTEIERSNWAVAGQLQEVK